MFEEYFHNVNIIIIKNETLLFGAFLRLLHWNLFGQWRTFLFSLKQPCCMNFLHESSGIDSQVYVNKDGLTKTEIKHNNNHR